MRIATPPRSSLPAATSTHGAGRTGSTFLSRHRRSSTIATIPTGETTSARHRRPVTTRLTPCSASRWEAAYDLRPGEWPGARPATLLCVVLRSDRGELSPRAGDGTLLLRSEVLRRAQQGRRPRAAEASGNDAANRCRAVANPY